MMHLPVGVPGASATIDSIVAAYASWLPGRGSMAVIVSASYVVAGVFGLGPTSVPVPASTLPVPGLTDAGGGLHAVIPATSETAQTNSENRRPTIDPLLLRR